MSIERTDFDAISENDLQQLVVGQVPEGLRLEYKRAAYGTSDADKRELLKDVSALANASGGHLIIGIVEGDGVARELIGLDAAVVDSELLRMENLVHSGIEPRIAGMRMRQIALANGKQAIVLRIPRSWNSPHRVIAQGVNRFTYGTRQEYTNPAWRSFERCLIDQNLRSNELCRFAINGLL